mmetsp:Transcript_13198/g.30177  ORF Transcript_13198/g.30177 Transcript_13198/m.30177 type:complete len:256 (+) Transcript_13198:744-1511(+)
MASETLLCPGHTVCSCRSILATLYISPICFAPREMHGAATPRPVSTSAAAPCSHPPGSGSACGPLPPRAITTLASPSFPQRPPLMVADGICACICSARIADALASSPIMIAAHDDRPGRGGPSAARIVRSKVGGIRDAVSGISGNAFVHSCECGFRLHITLTPPPGARRSTEMLRASPSPCSISCAFASDILSPSPSPSTSMLSALPSCVFVGVATIPEATAPYTTHVGGSRSASFLATTGRSSAHADVAKSRHT